MLKFEKIKNKYIYNVRINTYIYIYTCYTFTYIKYIRHQVLTHPPPLGSIRAAPIAPVPGRSPCCRGPSPGRLWPCSASQLCDAYWPSICVINGIPIEYIWTIYAKYIEYLKKCRLSLGYPQNIYKRSFKDFAVFLNIYEKNNAYGVYIYINI